MIKSMSHLDESSFEILIDDLVTRFVTKCSDDKISDLLEFVELMMTSSDDYGPITILVCQLISVLSYHPSLQEEGRIHQQYSREQQTYLGHEAEIL